MSKTHDRLPRQRHLDLHMPGPCAQASRAAAQAAGTPTLLSGRFFWEYRRILCDILRHYAILHDFHDIPIVRRAAKLLLKDRLVKHGDLNSVFK
eukprot:4451844-Prymnesium_polylepis.1